MARLPQPGSDQGTWGEVLNNYLLQAHAANGTLKTDSVGAAQLAPNSVTASAIVNGAVTAQQLDDGTITEAKLDTSVQAKLNSGGTAGVTSVNTRTGAVTLTKTDVGLANADNTNDANKPISTATQTALNLKASTSALAAVATSGSYADLANKPSIPVVSGTNTGDQTISIAGNTLSISGDNGNTISIPTGGSGGATNLNTSTTANAVTILSDTGSSATIPTTTTSAAGVLSVTDKSKLDGIAEGAQVNTVTSVASKTGAVTLTKTDVGLANADNTADSAKPISTAVQTALNAKVSTSVLATVATSGSYADLSNKPSSTAPDASSSVKGVVQLTGDLGGTAASPIVTKTYTKSNVGLANVDNISAANLRDRSTHTGTQASTTITGLGNASTKNVGTTAGTIAAGDDARFSVAQSLAIYELSTPGVWTADAPSRPDDTTPVSFWGISDPADPTNGVTTPANIQPSDRWVVEV